ncbi:MAG TPA: 8-oxo-dGTP diphosphatase [Candidatus Saccharimonadales bacterium]|nr:8-oxo-dGTP diphosphatase [Candidatus Saccharimonadales bacterium]
MTEKVCTLLFLRRDDEILLAMKKRGFGSNRYNGVGGKIEPGETIEQALERECQEEIGVTPLHYWKVAEHDFMQKEGNMPWRMYVHAYLCDKWEGEPIETDEMAPEWFKIQDIPYDAMWQDDEYWLPQVLAGDKVSGEYTFDENDRMLTHDIHVVETLPGIIPSSPKKG